MSKVPVAYADCPVCETTHRLTKFSRVWTHDDLRNRPIARCLGSGHFVAEHHRELIAKMDAGREG